MKNDPAVLATPDYRRFIESLKARVTAARGSAARHVNRDMILLYWDIGRAIDNKQHILGWGESVIDRISDDLRAAFPAATGFSPRNLRDMKRFYLAYTDEAIWRQPVAELVPYTKCLQDKANLSGTKIACFLQQLVAEIPWGHNLLILNKLIDPGARLWYLQARPAWVGPVMFYSIRSRSQPTNARRRTKRATTSISPCPSTYPSRPKRCSKAPTTLNSSASAGR